MIDGLRHFYEHTASFSILRLRFLLRTTQLFSLSIHSERYGWLSLSLFPSLPLWNFPKMDLFSFPRGDTRRHLSGAHQTRQLPRFKSQTLIALKFEPEPHRNRTGTAPEPQRTCTESRQPSALKLSVEYIKLSRGMELRHDRGDTYRASTQLLLSIYQTSTDRGCRRRPHTRARPMPSRPMRVNQGSRLSALIGANQSGPNWSPAPVDLRPTSDLLETYLRPTNANQPSTKKFPTCPNVPTQTAASAAAL